MSLAEKLYKIGQAIADEEIIKSLIKREAEDYNYVAINFVLDNGNNIKYDKILSNANANAFYSEKLGGSSTAIYYLYPNLIVNNEILIKVQKNKKGEVELKGKFSQLIATLNNIITNHYANEKNEQLLRAILEQMITVEIIDKLQNYPKGKYLYLVTINNKSLFEVMPEIWENWFRNPVTPYTDLETKTFYDFISSDELQEIGYNPEIGCYTVNNYNDNLKHRILDNLPLSQESARYIKFGWLYAKKHLLFYFDGMNFMILPSYAKGDSQEFQTILSKLKTANEQSHQRRNTLKNLANEERKLKDELNKLEKAKNRDELKVVQKKEDLKRETDKKNALFSKISDGLFTNFKDEVQELESIQGITLDFIFMELNKNEVKIYGSLEEVLPSRISKVVQKMRHYNINDTLKIGNKDKTQTYLHDFFHRTELYFYKLNKRKNDPKDASYRPKILEERFYLAKLLLTDSQISKTDLHKRFEFNAEFDYEHKKRVDDKGSKVWFYKNSGLEIYQDEQNILSFFEDGEINKIKDE